MGCHVSSHRRPRVERLNTQEMLKLPETFRASATVIRQVSI